MHSSASEFILERKKEIGQALLIPYNQRQGKPKFHTLSALSQSNSRPFGNWRIHPCFSTRVFQLPHHVPRVGGQHCRAISKETEADLAMQQSNEQHRAPSSPAELSVTHTLLEGSYPPDLGYPKSSDTSSSSCATHHKSITPSISPLLPIPLGINLHLHPLICACSVSLYSPSGSGSPHAQCCSHTSKLCWPRSIQPRIT